MMQTSSSPEDVTTEMTIFDNTTISVPPKGLSDGTIAGIVIGITMIIMVLVFLAFIIYKYRQWFLEILDRDSKQSNNNFISVS